MTLDQKQSQKALNNLVVRSVRDAIIRMVQENGGTALALSLAQEVADAFVDGYAEAADELTDLSPYKVKDYALQILQDYIFTTDQELRSFRDCNHWAIVRVSEVHAGKRLMQYTELKTTVRNV